MIMQRRTAIKQYLFLEIFEYVLDVRQTCQVIGISRSTYYNWLDKDVRFKNQLDKIEKKLSVEYEILNLVAKKDNRKAINNYLNRTKIKRGVKGAIKTV